MTVDFRPAGSIGNAGGAAVRPPGVTRGGFGPGSAVAEMVSGGWPAVLASLKTLLETGDPLPIPA